jgi:TonB family protein
VTSTTFPFENPLARRGSDRRLSIAIAVSVVIHALTLAALRGLPATPYTFAEGGVGSLPALQAVLAGPAAQPEPEEPTPLEPMINPNLVQPPVAKPVETLFGRKPAATTPIPGGGPTRPGPASPDFSVAVGTIADPARLGPDYVAQLAQRFPKPVQKVPMLLGAPVVVYPRPAIEAGIEGRFAALVTVDPQGRVTDAKMVVEDPLFGPVMLAALKDAEFAPAQFDGDAVAYWAIVEFIFTIGRPAPPSVASAPSRNRATLPRQPGVGR